MRNVFDQYSQAENRLTHSLATALDQDKRLLHSFLKTFGPKGHPPASRLAVTEQGLPGKPESLDEEESSRGLPDAVIFDSAGWALVIESKISDRLKRSQLIRHIETVRRCGCESVHGLAITVEAPKFAVENWRVIEWKDIYSWGSRNIPKSEWAKFMVEFFNVAESKMANDKYLKEGTITEFSGISFDTYTYLEAKRILRLLTGKIRANREFIKFMRLDELSERSAITEQARLWDYISFTNTDGRKMPFSKYPHCTVAIGADTAEAMITFPNGMSNKLRNRLRGDSYDNFRASLDNATDAIVGALPTVIAYRPIVRVMQRRYPSQKSVPLMDGRVVFDLRALRGEENPPFGPAIRCQAEWGHIANDLISNKNSNIQFQIGAEFDYGRFSEFADRSADEQFLSVFRALRDFAGRVID